MNFSVLSQEEIEALLKDTRESAGKSPNPVRDEVTGLYNLGFFAEEFRRAQARLIRQKFPCTIGIVRVDGIPSLTGKKDINARIFWAKFGKLLRTATREKSEDLIAVIEPGLFVILVPNDLPHAILVMERILYSVETTPFSDWGEIDGADFQVSLTEVNPNEELDPILFRVSKGIQYVSLAKNTRWHWEHSSGQVFMRLSSPNAAEDASA
ncbi:MAG: GGDEF domain-containing protein [Nitrospirae bacterium]|jgi:GGDEF domain-containing protein|nr:GGDEF domain-containing protein [Nitrospirota bacterium]